MKSPFSLDIWRLFSSSIGLVALLLVCGCKGCVPIPDPSRSCLFKDTVATTTPCGFRNTSLYPKKHPLNFDRSVLDGGSDTLLGILGGDSLWFQVKYRDTTARYHTWAGSLLEREGSFFSFSDLGGLMSGTLGFDSLQYVLRQCRDSTVWLAEVNVGILPTEGAPMPGTVGSENEPSIQACVDYQMTTNLEIDLMCLYTLQAMHAAGLEAGVNGDTLAARIAMETEIAQAVSLANMAYDEAGLDMRINVVYMGLVDRTGDPAWETMGDYSGTIRKLPADSRVRQLRNDFAADLVSLFVEEGSECGRGNLFGQVGGISSMCAYSVVQRECASNKYSLAHELGHNFGLRHECAVEPSNTTEHGYIYKDALGRWRRTIMAVDTNVIRLPVFSSIEKKRGIANQGGCGSDEAAILRARAATVAAYRCSAYQSDTWICDDLPDRGREPYAENRDWAVLNSPSIWVRCDEDIRLVHVGLHQNARSGTNFLYVRLRNPSARQVHGTVVAYGSEASMDWRPSPRNQLGDGLEVTLAPQSNTIVKYPFDKKGNGRHQAYAVQWHVPGEAPLPDQGQLTLPQYARMSNNVAVKALAIVRPGLGTVPRNGRSSGPSGASRDTLVLKVWPSSSISFEVGMVPNEQGQTFEGSGGRVTCQFDPSKIADGVDTTLLEPHLRPSQEIPIRSRYFSTIPAWVGGSSEQPSEMRLFFDSGRITQAGTFYAQLIVLGADPGTGGQAVMGSITVCIEVGGDDGE